MDKTLIRWKLREVMDKHGIQAKSLAEAMSLSQNALTNLRSGDMPRINGERLNSLLMCLNRLRRQGTAMITPSDLIEFTLSLNEASEVEL